jgi:hypothetical protein
VAPAPVVPQPRRALSRGFIGSTPSLRANLPEVLHQWALCIDSPGPVGGLGAVMSGGRGVGVGGVGIDGG